MAQFERLFPYQKSEDFVVEVFGILASIRGEFELKNQLKRAALSIPCNLAEGLGRITPRDQKHFFTIARSSLNECICLMNILYRLGYVDAEKKLRIQESLEQVSAYTWKMIKNREAKL